jgi:hypothetical protein
MERKNSLHYERYLFRLIVQDKSESFDSFVERIKFQSQKCNFADEEGTIIDQIIEKCSDNELRNKAFENQMTLNQLVLTGKILEQAAQNSNTKTAVESPKRDYEISTSNRSYERRSPARERQECSRCGRHDHDESDRNCPGKRGLCKICQKPGHFAVKCFAAKSRKRVRSRSPIASDRKHSRWENNSASASRRRRSISPPKSNENLMQNSQRPIDPRRSTKSDEKQNEQPQNFAECRIKIKTVESLSDPIKPASNSNSQTNILSANHQIPQNIKFKTQLSTSPISSPTYIPSDSQNYSSTSRNLTIQPQNLNFYQCEIGGMATKYVIKQSYPANVISKGLFRKFREEKHHFQTCDMVPISMENMKFTGHFTTLISGPCLKTFYITFHVREGNEDFVILNKRMAQLLGLIP